MNDIPGIGHNIAPSDLDLLLADAQRNAEEAAQCPVELDTISAPTATDMVKILTRLADKIERARKAEQAPHVDASKEIMGRCAPLLTAMETAKAAILTRLHRYRTDNKIETVEGSFAKAHEARREKLVIDNPSLVPPQFLMINEQAIEHALRTGLTVQGARLVPVLSTQVR